MCAFADAVQHVHKDCKKHTIKRVILFTQHPHYVLFFSIIEDIVLMALIFTWGIFSNTEHAMKTICGELQKLSTSKFY